MKRLFFSMSIISMFLFACTSTEQKADTGDAGEVATSTEGAVSFKTVSTGSILNWRAEHLGGIQKRFGKVSLKSAELNSNAGKLSSAVIMIDMASLTVESFEDAESKTKLTGHLQSADFFKVETFPTSKFEMTGISEATGEYNSKVTGNLTILDKTKSITFNANVVVSDSEIAVKSEDFSIDRRDWGLTYNVEGTAGVPVDYLIANEIGFTIDIKVAK